MQDKTTERTIKWLKSLMAETAILLQELENPAEKEPVPSMWTPRQELPKDLDELITSCELKENWWHIKIKYVSSETFAKFAAALRSMNGKYISAGKNSEFQVPNKKA